MTSKIGFFFAIGIASLSFVLPAAAELYIRPTVANTAAYTSERWGIRIPLPAPNVLCGTAGQTDRGASAYLFVDDIDLCGSGGRFDDILLRVSIRSNLSGFEEFRTPPPPIRREIAKDNCGVKSDNDPSFKELPRVAGLPAFLCHGDKAARGPYEGLVAWTAYLFRGRRDEGYPEVDYTISVSAPPARAAEARAALEWILARIRLRPL